MMRWRWLLALGLLAALPVRAEYAVLRNGQRVHITGYERVGEFVRLQVPGGSLEVAAEQLVAIEPEDVFPALTATHLNVPYSALIAEAAKANDVDQELIASVIAVESNFNPRAVSPRMARGLMQLLPKVAARFQVTDVFDPKQNIDAGTRYLKELLGRYHQDLALALAAYNAGPDRVERYRGIPPFAETRSYVRRVTQNLKTRKAKKPARGSAPLASAARTSPRGARTR